MDLNIEKILRKMSMRKLKKNYKQREYISGFFLEWYDRLTEIKRRKKITKVRKITKLLKEDDEN